MFSRGIEVGHSLVDNGLSFNTQIEIVALNPLMPGGNKKVTHT